MMLCGLPAIAKALGVADKDTVTAYARRRRDPLPLVRWRGSVRIDAAILARWKRRDVAKNDRINDASLEYVQGIIAIAACLRLTVRTVYTLARSKKDPLPINDLGGRYPWIWRGALEDWNERQAVPWQVGDGKEDG
jgi:hypothetical protein